MKYIVYDSVDGDVFTKEFDDIGEAIACAKIDWEHLSDRDKKRRDSFCVLKSLNPDEEAENHLDGMIAWDAQCVLVAMVAKWVDGSGISYATEYWEKPAYSDLSWEDIDDSWADELLDDLDTSCERFKVWYKLCDKNGLLMDESGYFWVEGEGYNV